jgi:hypothetical protein
VIERRSAQLPLDRQTVASTHLRVMLLAIDGAARAVLQSLDSRAFVKVQATTIGAASRFVVGDAGLLTLDMNGFARGQAAALQSLGNPHLLMLLTLIDSGLGWQCSGERGNAARNCGEGG